MEKVLAWRPLQEMGRLSYSWYLWHWPVLVFAAGLQFTEIHTLSPLYRLALVLLSLGLAEASYRFVENPLRHQRWVSATSKRSLAMGGLLTAFGLVLALGWGRIAARQATGPEQARFTAAALDRDIDCIDLPLADALRDCVMGDVESDTTVVLYGDSHANNWLLPMAEVAASEGWRLVPLLKSSCPPTDAPVWRSWRNSWFVKCDVWRAEALAEIEAIRPALTVVAMATVYDFTDEQWIEGTARTYGRLASASGRVVQLRETPRSDFDVPACLGRAAWRETGASCDVRRDHAYVHVDTLISAATARFGAVHEVDLNGSLCAGTHCPAEIGGVVVYRDSNHLTSTFARSLTPTLAEAVTLLK